MVHHPHNAAKAQLRVLQLLSGMQPSIECHAMSCICCGHPKLAQPHHMKCMSPVMIQPEICMEDTDTTSRTCTSQITFQRKIASHRHMGCMCTLHQCTTPQASCTAAAPCPKRKTSSFLIPLPACHLRPPLDPFPAKHGRGHPHTPAGAKQGPVINSALPHPSSNGDKSRHNTALFQLHASSLLHLQLAIPALSKTLSTTATVAPACSHHSWTSLPPAATSLDQTTTD